MLLSLLSIASAQQYWEKSALLGDMFPQSEKVAPQVLTLSAEEKAAAEAALGYPLGRQTWTFYVASTADRIDGYALFDDQVGQHEPITFCVQLDPQGVVLRQEVVVYREKYGSEVRSERFSGQFTGKSATDPIQHGVDIKNVSGATYSSKAMAIGVKRATVLGAVVVGHAQDSGAQAETGDLP